MISSQGKHFPKELALMVAVNAIEECVQEFPDIDIILTIYGTWTEKLSPELFTSVSQFISEFYIPNDDYIAELMPELFVSEVRYYRALDLMDAEIAPDIDSFGSQSKQIDIKDLIDDLIKKPTQANLDKIPVDETFGAMLARLLKENNLPHSAVQDEIGMSGPGFWKLLNGKSNPSKMTVFGIAIALKLSLDDTREMLMKAGYAINQSSLQDIIVSGLIQKKIYDRNIIDDLLYSLDLQPLLGA